MTGAFIDISPFCRSSYTQLSEPQKSGVLEYVGKLSCALTGNLVQRPSEVISREMLFCEVCDGVQKKQKEEYNGQGEEEFGNLWEIFNFILPKLTRTPGPRIAAMIALRRLLMHSTNLNQMQLSTSTSGEFCLHSLRSSIRELRIATGYSSLVPIALGIANDHIETRCLLLYAQISNRTFAEQTLSLSWNGSRICRKKMTCLYKRHAF